MQDLSYGFLSIRPKSHELRKDEFWAVENINFELYEGEILGIIGANGSGKSTLLRILTGIFPPDRGRISIDGSVGGIIALGAGMHPHMTGRENIYLNGTVLGLTKPEIDRLFDEIVDFSELSSFLDAPISTYSSGMKVRLGFAVAVHCKPEILLVDEVLSVGDLNFQNKCMRKLREVRDQAKAVIFISHSMENIELLCTRLIVLNDGGLLFEGKVREGIAVYENIQNKVSNADVGEIAGKNSGDIEIKSVNVQDEDNNEIREIKEGRKFLVVYQFSSKIQIDDVIVSSTIRDSDGRPLIWNRNSDLGKNIKVNIGMNKICVTYLKSNLKSGIYFLTFSIKNSKTGEYYIKVISKDYWFKITSPVLSRGYVQSDVQWEYYNNLIK
ncbi:MAG: ABC transporter ATP-binding protein [Cyclobacteriaceae bacterium]